MRVPWNDPAEIMWVLDAGASGVIVPMVNDAESTRAAVGACRFAPVGFRSWGPTRAALHTGSRSPEQMDRDVLCIVMVETVEAVDRLEDILAVPGIDGVFVGPSDLSITLGVVARGITLGVVARAGCGCPCRSRRQA